MPTQKQPEASALTKILLDTDALLAALREYYILGRYLPTFPEKPYFLFSQCARLLHEFEVAREGSDMSTEPGNDHFMCFLRKIYLHRLRVFQCAKRPTALPSDTGPFRNEAAWCRFWFNALQETGCLTGADLEEPLQSLLACVGANGVLAEQPGQSERDTVSEFFRTAEAGQLIIHSEWVLEDISTAIMCWLTKRDAKRHITELLQAAACALRQERQRILWSATPTGPYRMTRSGPWGRPGGFAGFRLGGKRGELAIAMRDDGGKISCVFEWPSGAESRQMSWQADASTFNGSYEEALFETWSYETGLLIRGPKDLQETPASWRIGPLEADDLGLVSRWTSLLVDAIGRHPTYEPLAITLRTQLRAGKERWAPGRIHWTYIQEMDTLIETVNSAWHEIWSKIPEQAQTVATEDQEEVESQDCVASVVAAEQVQAEDENEECCPDSVSVLCASVSGATPRSEEPSRTTSYSAGPACGEMIAPGSDINIDQGVADEEATEWSDPEPEIHDDSVPVDELQPSSEPAGQEEASHDRDMETSQKPPRAVVIAPSQEVDSQEQEITDQRVDESPSRSIDAVAYAPKTDPSAPYEISADEPACVLEQSSAEELPCDSSPTQEVQVVESQSSDESATDERASAPERNGAEERPRDSLPRQEAQVIEAQSSSESASGKKQRPCRKRKPISRAASAPALIDPKKPSHRLIKKLLAHHVRKSGTIRCEPLSRKQMQERLKWTQSQVQNAMKRLFGDKPFAVYKQKCKEQTIGDFLQDDRVWTL